MTSLTFHFASYVRVIKDYGLRAWGGWCLILRVLYCCVVFIIYDALEIELVAVDMEYQKTQENEIAIEHTWYSFLLRTAVQQNDIISLPPSIPPSPKCGGRLITTVDEYGEGSWTYQYCCASCVLGVERNALCGVFWFLGRNPYVYTTDQRC